MAHRDVRDLPLPSPDPSQDHVTGGATAPSVQRGSWILDSSIPPSGLTDITDGTSNTMLVGEKPPHR